MASTSLSQLFVHLAQLECSVQWSRSALNARCKLCRKRSDPEKMLLCDGCDKGFHMFCLTPKMKVGYEQGLFVGGQRICVDSGAVVYKRCAYRSHVSGEDPL